MSNATLYVVADRPNSPTGKAYISYTSDEGVPISSPFFADAMPFADHRDFGGAGQVCATANEHFGGYRVERVTIAA